MIAVRQPICYARLNINFMDNESEIVGIAVELGPHLVHVYSVYQAPNRSHLSENIPAILEQQKAIILAGDFNVKSPLWGSRISIVRGRELVQVIASTKATPHYPEDPTSTKRVHLTKPRTCLALSSDHFPVLANLAFYPSDLSRGDKTFTNWPKFAYHMSSFRESPSNDTREKLTHLTSFIQKTL